MILVLQYFQETVAYRPRDFAHDEDRSQCWLCAEPGHTAAQPVHVQAERRQSGSVEREESSGTGFSHGQGYVKLYV